MEYEDFTTKIREIDSRWELYWRIAWEMEWIKELLVDEDEWQDWDYVFYEFIVKLEDWLYKLYMRVDYDEEIYESNLTKVEGKKVYSIEYQDIWEKVEL